MAGAGTQVGLQLPTSMSQLPAQPPPGDSALSFGRLSGSAGPSQNPPDPDPEPDPEKKSVTNQSMPSEKDVSSSTASR